MGTEKRKKQPLHPIHEIFLAFSNATLNEANGFLEVFKKIRDALIPDPNAPGRVNLKTMSEWMAEHPPGAGKADSVWTALEADQKTFVCVLAGLTEGKRFKDIKGFEQLIRDGRARPKLIPRVDLASDKVLFFEWYRFDPVGFWDKTFQGRSPTKNFKEDFQDNIKAIVRFSLAHYLVHAIDPRQRLRRCDYKNCKKFFVSTTTMKGNPNPEVKSNWFCNDGCRRGYHWDKQKKIEEQRKEKAKQRQKEAEEKRKKEAVNKRKK